MTIRYERLPYRIHTEERPVPWRGTGEIVLHVERDPDFDAPLHLHVVDIHPAFEVQRPKRTLELFDDTATFVVVNRGHVPSVEPRFGYTLRIEDGRRTLDLRLGFEMKVLVTTEMDAGPGSLRDLLAQADAIPHPREIHFLPSVRRVHLRSPLTFRSDQPLRILGPPVDVHHPEASPTGVATPKVWILGSGTGRLLLVGGHLTLARLGLAQGHDPDLDGCLYVTGRLELDAGVWLRECSAGRGGGIAVARGGAIFFSHGLGEIRFVTVTQNEAARGAGIHAAGHYLSIAANVLAGNGGGDLRAEDATEVFSDGFNLVGRPPLGAMLRLNRNDFVGTVYRPLDPRLSGWVDDRLSYRPPEPDSLAVNLVPVHYCAKFTDEMATDQRGVRRPLSGACDAGAVEMY